MKENEKAKLTYPKHQLKPEDTLNFIEMEGWARDCKKVGLTAQDQAALRVCIMSGPTMMPVVRGTGGLRKFRFAPSRWNTGKRGAVRICFVYIKEYSIALLVKVYSKRKKDNLSTDEKMALRTAIGVIRSRLAEKTIS